MHMPAFSPKITLIRLHQIEAVCATALQRATAEQAETRKGRLLHTGASDSGLRTYMRLPCLTTLRSCRTHDTPLHLATEPPANKHFMCLAHPLSTNAHRFLRAHLYIACSIQGCSPPASHTSAQQPMRGGTRSAAKAGPPAKERPRETTSSSSSARLPKQGPAPSSRLAQAITHAEEALQPAQPESPISKAATSASGARRIRADPHADARTLHPVPPSLPTASQPYSAAPTQSRHESPPIIIDTASDDDSAAAAASGEDGSPLSESIRSTPETRELMRVLPDEALDANSPIHSPAQPTRPIPLTLAEPAVTTAKASATSNTTRNNGARRAHPPAKVPHQDTPFPRERVPATAKPPTTAVVGDAADNPQTPTKPSTQHTTLKRTALQRSPQHAAPGATHPVAAKRLRAATPAMPPQAVDDVFTQNEPRAPSLPAPAVPQPPAATTVRNNADLAPHIPEPGSATTPRSSTGPDSRTITSPRRTQRDDSPEYASSDDDNPATARSGPRTVAGPLIGHLKTAAASAPSGSRTSDLVFTSVPIDGFPHIHGRYPGWLFDNIDHDQLLAWQSFAGEKAILVLWGHGALDADISPSFSSLFGLLRRVLHQYLGADNARLSPPIAQTPPRYLNRAPFSILVFDLTAAQRSLLLTNRCLSTPDVSMFFFSFALQLPRLVLSFGRGALSGCTDAQVRKAAVTNMRKPEHNAALLALVSLSPELTANATPRRALHSIIKSTSVDNTPFFAKRAVPLPVFNLYLDIPISDADVWLRWQSTLRSFNWRDDELGALPVRGLDEVR